MTVQDWVKLFALETGEPLLAIDGLRALRWGLTRQGAEVVAEANGVRVANGVSVIPLQGPLANRGGWARSGMDAFRDRLAAAASNADIGAIVIDADSPGGTVAGTPETAAAVREAAAVKPVVAVVNTLAASAAYWIVSGASQIVMTPSAEVGSIGVLSMHLDFSQALENDGIKATVIRSVPFKAEAGMFEPLTDEARAHIEGEVGASHAQFVRDVAMGRKVSMAKVNAEFGQGRTVTADKAIAAGMADRVGTLSDVIASARNGRAVVRRRAAIV